MAEVEIFSEQGANLLYTIVVTEDTSGASINIANFSFTSKVRKSYNTGVVANLICSVFDAANGSLSISMGAANTMLLPAPVRYVFDVIALDNTTNFTYKLVEGVMIHSPSVSI